MAVITNLIALDWIKGEDGHPAFWKIAYISLLILFAGVVWHLLALFDKLIEKNMPVAAFSDILWPLLWFFALFLSAAFGFKGIQAWLQRANLKTAVEMNTTNTYAAINAITQNRDKELGIDPTS